jgi:hypothetical protein
MSPSARLGLLTLLWMTPVASAEPLKVRLEYLQDEASLRCSSQEALRGSISARLGRDPWDDTAPELLRVQVRREQVRWQATVEWFGASGQRKGLRELSSEREDCQELIQALELAITLVLDPPLFYKPRAEPPPSPTVSSAPIPASEVPPLPSPAPTQPLPPPAPSVPSVPSAPDVQAPPVESPSRAPDLALGLGTRASWGLLPATRVGLQAEGELRFERWSFSLDATAWPPRTTPVELVRLRSMLFAAGARACVHVGPFGACPQLSAGLLRLEGVGLENAKPAQAPWLAPGARLFVEWRSPLPRFRLRLLAEGQFILTRHRFLAGEVELWRPPQAGGSLGLLGMWDTKSVTD